MAADSRRAYEEALARLDPSLRRAFEDAIRDVRSAAKVAAIEEAAAVGDWRAVVEIMRMDERVFDRLDREIQNAFYQGGVYQLAHLGGRGAALLVRFQGRHPRAEAWARERGSGLVSEIVADQREVIREAVVEGLAEGNNPRKTALDIVGRVDGGSRSGGVVGLHSTQARWVAALRRELADPATASGYFDRRARDKRFDGTVRRAIRDGKPVSQADIDRIAGRYADRLLKLRGDMIARTESIAALNAGRMEAIEQMIERGEVPRDAVTVTWSATMDGRTRDLHRIMNGQKVDFGEAFVSPTGARLRHPGDTSLGAQGEDVINCRCYAAPRIDWLSLAR